MDKTLISLILIGLSGWALASEPPSTEREPVRQQMLDKARAIESHSHRSRIRILQDAEHCIQAAKTRQDYRSCEQKEQRARERLREELRPRHQALRDEVRQMRQAQQTESQAAKP